MGLTDMDLMPFGEHAGKKMEDVPARWLHWLWLERIADGKKGDNVEEYIEENLNALEKEYPNGIW